jgi:cytochrome P450
MSTDLESLPLPPGNRYFPLLGETLDFLKDAFGFIARRAEEHGPIFRTHLLGRPTVFLVGSKVSHVFLDEALCTRDDAMPENVRELLGGRSVALLDGAEHRARKGQILAAFVPEALPSYVPAMAKLIEASLDSWAARGEIRAIEELKLLAISAIARNVVSMEAGPDLDAILAGFKTVTAGFTGLPIALPGTAYSKAKKARDAIFAILRRVVAEHRQKTYDDGLGRMLAHRGEGGASLSDEDAVKELHHIFIAGYIVFAELAEILVALAERPDLREALAAEALARASARDLTARAVGGLSQSWRFVQEIKRTTPVVPVAFGRARKSFELQGYRVPAGTALFWATYLHNQDPAIFTNPDELDPERFSDARAEHQKHELAFAPQGMGPALGHKCPGTDYATLLMQVFTTVLVRDYAFTLPEQDLRLDASKLPPEPADGLRVIFRKERAAATEPQPTTKRAATLAAGQPAAQPQLDANALRALACVIWADGEVKAEEAEALVRIARASGLDDAEVAEVERATRERVSVETMPPLSFEGATAEHVFSLACLLAAADGSVDPRERAVVSALGDRLALTDAARARATLASRAVARELGATSAALAALAAELERDKAAPRAPSRPKGPDATLKVV